MEAYATSTELRASLAFNIIVALAATPVLLKSIQFIRKTKVFHVNTRLQILVHLYALLLHTVGRLVMHSIDLYNYLTFPSDACEIIPNFYRCLILRGCYNIGLALSSMCSIALVLERCAAYHSSNNYENCPKSFGYRLVFLQFFLAGCYLTSMYFTAAFQPGNFTLYYCQTIASSSGSVWYVIVPIYSVVVALLVSRVMFWQLMRKCEVLRADSFQTLSCHFIMQQTMRSISALKLLIDLNCFLFVVLSVVVTTLHFHLDQLKPPLYMALVETTHFLPLYSILVSFAVRWKLEYIEKQQQKDFNERIESSHGIENHFAYFLEVIK